MDALFRIMAVIGVTDRASGPINKIAGAISRLGKVAIAGVLGGFGMKSLYNWTVGASAEIQMMTMGIQSVISANSTLNFNLAESTKNIAAMHRNGQLTTGEFKSMNAQAQLINESTKQIQLNMEKIKGGAVISPTQGVSSEGVAAVTVEKFKQTEAIANNISESLQQWSIIGIGTLEDYMRTANIILPQVAQSFAAVGQSMGTQAGQDQFSEMVHNAQLAASVLLSGMEGQARYNTFARQLARLLAGNATTVMQGAVNLMSGMPLKEFNELTRAERWNLIQDRLREYGVLSHFLQGTWSNIASAAQEFAQYIGRNIGLPIRKALEQMVTGTKLWRDLSGEVDLSLPKEMQAAEAAERSRKAWADIRNKAQQVGETIVTFINKAVEIFRKYILPVLETAWSIAVQAAKHWKSIAATLLTAAITLKAVKLAGVVARAGGMAALGARTFDAIAFMNPYGIMLTKLGNVVGAALGGLGMRLMMLGGNTRIAALGFKMLDLATGPLYKRMFFLGGVLTLVAAGVFFMIRAMQKAIETNFQASSAWERIQNRLREVAEMITGQVYPAGTSLLQMFGDITSRIIDWLVPAAVWLIQQIEQMIIIIQVVGESLIYMTNLLNWLAEEGPRAFGRLVNGILQHLSGGIIEGFINGLPNDGSREAAQKVFDNLPKIFGTGSERPTIEVPFHMQGPLRPNEHRAPPPLPDFSRTMNSGNYNAKHGPPQLPPHAPKPEAGVQNPMSATVDTAAAAASEAAKDRKRSHPKTVNNFHKGAIQIEIKNMNNYPPDRIAHDMKRIMMDKVNYKTGGSSNGWSGNTIHGYGGR